MGQQCPHLESIYEIISDQKGTFFSGLFTFHI